MKCPFCAEEVKDDATVCKHCRYDLTVVRALMERIEDLTKQLQSVAGVPAVTREQSIRHAPELQDPHPSGPLPSPASLLAIFPFYRP
jgi:hypothetical protein